MLRSHGLEELDHNNCGYRRPLRQRLLHNPSLSVHIESMTCHYTPVQTVTAVRLRNFHLLPKSAAAP
jgi:hypothetical protein